MNNLIIFEESTFQVKYNFDFLLQMIYHSIFKTKIYFWILYSSAHGLVTWAWLKEIFHEVFLVFI